MASSDSSANRSPSVAGRSNKSSTKSKLIVLKLSPALLRKFPVDPKPENSPDTKAKSITEETKNVAEPSSPSPNSTPAIAQPSSADNASDAASTPAPSTTEPAAPKPPPAPRGTKRGLGPDGLPKPRGKPGPKKKIRLEDGSEAPPSRPSGHGSHKLGPKANQGAINAGLRALDRTGKPCRKWERKSFQLKSFTGVVWRVPSWEAPIRTNPLEDSSDGTKEGTTAGDANSKANNSAVQSEKSNSGEGDASTPLPSIVESSPAPVPVAS
ncbi:hypothetical protein FQN57_000760 [Myotisia sp. PD_48]|nr:hypothetical protein FQN57_000760 [Myotisia sp. PD_48]